MRSRTIADLLSFFLLQSPSSASNSRSLVPRSLLRTELTALLSLFSLSYYGPTYGAIVASGESPPLCKSSPRSRFNSRPRRLTFFVFSFSSPSSLHIRGPDPHGRRSSGHFLPSHGRWTDHPWVRRNRYRDR